MTDATSTRVLRQTRRDAEQTAPPQPPPTLRQARHNVRPGTLADLRLCCETNRRNIRHRPANNSAATSATGSPAAPRPLAV